MSTRDTDNKLRTSAILNIVAGLLFFVAAFNLLTGDPGVNWMYLVVGAIFVGGGIWGMVRPRK